MQIRGIDEEDAPAAKKIAAQGETSPTQLSNKKYAK